MSHVLDKGARNLIESEALKLQRILNLQSEPNVYDFSSVNTFFKEKGWRFQFDVKLKEINNSMEQDDYMKNSMEYMIKYNIIDSKKIKTLQFDISNPKNLENKFEYVMFLRAIFYEYWGELKKSTKFNGIEFEDNLDYKLFSRAMIIPYQEFIKIPISIPDYPRIYDVANTFNVIFSVVEDRIIDCSWISDLVSVLD
ncbi:MAG: hypothetical protein K6B70_04940 [Clostridia bacterium]|nr:hypothetical protein [Clostridia bacterium]